MLMHVGRGLAVPFVAIGTCYAVGYGVSRLIRVSKGWQGIFQSMFFTANSIFSGLPVNVACLAKSACLLCCFA